MKFLVFTFTFSILAIHLGYSQPPPTPLPPSQQNFILPQDSLLISIGPSGERFLHYRIRKGQTLYGFCRYVNLSLQRVLSVNPGIKEQSVEAGQWLRFPLPSKTLKTNRTPGFRTSEFPSVYYPVRKGDNLYRVANVLLNVHPDTLKLRNGLSTDQLQEGRMLHIGWFVAQNMAEPTKEIPPGEWPMDQAGLSDRYHSQGLDRKEVQQTGKAAWKKNQAANSGFSCLHSFAPVNSVISVLNPMNGRELYVKVIGRIPDTVYDKGTIVVLSPAAARFLGARDALFFAKVKYYQ